MSEQASTERMLQGFDPANLVKKGFALGCADLLQGGSLRQVVGQTVAFFLSVVRTKDDGRLFSGATVTLPPAQATDFDRDSILAAVRQAVDELRDSSVGDEEFQILGRSIHVLHVPSLEVSDLIRSVEEQGRDRLIIVAEASRFRDHTVELPPAFGATATRLPEDRWVPHVTSLLSRLAKAVKGSRRYALAHVNELPARKRSNQDLLFSVANTSVFELTLENNPEEVLAARSADWTSMAVQGRLDEVAAEMERLSLPDATKLHMLTHLAARTGRKRETFDLLRKLQPHLETVIPEIAIQVAQFALRFGDEDFANELLPKSPDGVSDPLWIEAGLDAATELEDNYRIAAFDARLEVLVPGSAALRENRDRRLLVNCQEAKTDTGLRFTTAGFGKHHLEIQMRLSEFEPDYNATIEAAQAWGQEWLELAVVCCAIHARSMERFREAADAASVITSSGVYGRQATQVLLYSIRSMMLRELVPENERDHYRRLFQAAFDYLAHFPADDGVRSYLISLLSVDSCGDQGVPLIALTMLDLVERGVTVPPGEEGPGEKGADPLHEDVQTSIANAIRWMGEVGGGEPGVTVIPRDLIVASPDEVVKALGKLAQRASGLQGEDADLVFMEKLVFIACAVCPHSTHERDDDIRLLRLLAGNFAAAGQFQRARDFAEQILLMGQTSPLRQRLAWSAYADVHHRCHNYIVSLVGMACSLATDVAIPKADVWHEVYTIHRILRDLNLFDLARHFLPAMKTLLGDLGYDPETDARVVAADLALQLMQARNGSVDELQSLLVRIAAATESALGDRNQLFPLAILLGQAVAKVQAAGGEVPPAIQATLGSALQDVGSKVAITIRTVSAEKPSAKDVLAMFNEVQRASFAADVARDYSHIGLAARRLLDTSTQDVTESAFAIELLSDHAVKLPSEAPRMTVDWATQYAFEVNDAGCDVVFMAVDNAGELSVIHVGSRQVRAIEQPRHHQTFRRRFDAWLVKFPKEYGYIDPRDGNGTFYQTMEELDVCLPPSNWLVIVADPVLQQLTANLVVMQPADGGLGFLAGREFSIGAVPSLTWLAAARAAPRTGKAAYKAWISAQLEPELEGDESLNAEPRRVEPLDVVLQRLSGSFEAFGFEVDVSRRLPRNMDDAGLAVVTAHGDVSNDGRFLRRISDDARMVEAPSALAAALRGVEVVILFVCSGGRIDKNPWDNSTTSLAKQLLNGGTRAVIAAPWPLNVLVTYVWLEPFLKAWEQGATVLDATKAANDAVARHYGEVPQYSLAMRVYGDVLLTLSV
jgi:hypothetical protein